MKIKIPNYLTIGRIIIVPILLTAKTRSNGVGPFTALTKSIIIDIAQATRVT